MHELLIESSSFFVACSGISLFVVVLIDRWVLKHPAPVPLLSAHECLQLMSIFTHTQHSLDSGILFSAEVQEDNESILLLKRILVYSPKMRLTAGEALEHPWLATDV